MKIKEIFKGFTMQMSNDEFRMLERLQNVTPLIAFPENEQFIIENLIRKALVTKIRNTVIRKSRDGFLVFDVKTHQRVAETFSKRGAIAYAKAREKNRDHDCDHILSLDNLLCKQYMDSLFHKNVIEKTDDEWRKEAIITRFEIAKDKTFNTMDQIDQYIFDE
jgi:hypothetical protein